MKPSDANAVRQKLFDLRRTFDRYYDSFPKKGSKYKKRMLKRWALRLLDEWETFYDLNWYEEEDPEGLDLEALKHYILEA